MSRAGKSCVPLQDMVTRASGNAPTAQVVLTNRQAGPERVLDIAAARVTRSEDRIEDLISSAELEEVAAHYRQVAGFLKKGP